ncbi:uncharacterized protein [Chironomus tepperi]|uniref:uncharacterized protein n=1 Tax=Chironomus tepperi TaxID=113505 RepID=UPI00391FB2C5
MPDSLELQEFAAEEEVAFKSCENLLLQDSVLNDDIVGDLADENDSGENCQEISTCHDLNCTDHSLHELVDSLYNSTSPNQKADFLEMSLDDIQLTEGDSNNILQIIPENVPDDKLMLLKIPDYLQDSNLLNDIMGIELDQSILDEIEKAVRESEGAFVYQSDEILSTNNEEVIEIIRRPPLQLIQQVINFPAVKNARNDKAAEDLKAANKRKQYFQFPREDLVEFYSDEENNINSQNQPITVNDDDGPSSPKKVRLEEPIIELPIIDDKPTETPDESTKRENKKPRFVIENCPRCDKSFKKLSMHKCRDPIVNNGPIKKLKPSDVSLPLKCEPCKAFFPNKEALDKHQEDKHSRLTCKVCKKVMKNIQGLKLHSAKCGIDIQPVKKFVPRYARNNK